MEEGQQLLMGTPDKNDSQLIGKLCVLLSHPESTIRKFILNAIRLFNKVFHIVKNFRNICFNKDLRTQILTASADILTKLLLLLRGPEQFDEEDCKGMSPALHNANNVNKQREPDASCRKVYHCISNANHRRLLSKHCYFLLQPEKTV